MRKLFILGLDSAPPKILYENYRVKLNTLKELIDESARYFLRSSHPPITIPAWISMFTGKTPGELGLYGFRHRRPGDVQESYIVNSTHIKHQTLWDILGRMGYKVGLVGVPPTYPPKPVHGFLITDFTTPSPEKPYTFPPWLKLEIEKRFGKHLFDVMFRSHEKDKVLDEIFRMTEQHLRVISYLLAKKEWDLFAYVEIGVDRIQHAFWKYFDEDHPRHIEDERYGEAIPRYYKLIDDWLTEARKLIPKDAMIMVVSDHGAKSMKGAFVINQWLEENGYLKLKEKPRRGRDLSRELIDWDRTIAWGWGGYYARIFINLRGREPRGIVKKEEYEGVVKQLKNDLRRVRGPNNERWRTEVYTPWELYPEVRGDPPDLIAYLDDLSWRSAGTLGWNTIYLPENDRGPDDAVHDWKGVLAIYDPEESIEKGVKGEIKIENVYGLIASLLSINPPP